MSSEMPPPLETPLSAVATPASGDGVGGSQSQHDGSNLAATNNSTTFALSLYSWRRMWPFRKQASAWFTSATLHATMLVVMCLLAEHVIKQLAPADLAVHTVSHEDALLEDLPRDTPATAPRSKPGAPGAATALPDGDLFGSSLEDSPLGIPDLGNSPTPGVKLDAQPQVDPLATALLPQGGGVSWGQALSKGGGGLGGRSPERRAQLVGSGGGSAASEDAVERGLKWLLAHQHDDGSWRFNFDGPPCDNLCRNPGNETSTTASTALALLPFYGAGYTHKVGPYTDQVNKGLYYLGSRMMIT